MTMRPYTPYAGPPQQAAHTGPAQNDWLASRPVSDTAPAVNDTLIWNGTLWLPGAPTPAAHTHSHDTELSGVSANDHHNEDHDHDGSPTQKLAQANTHESPDTDAATTSLHHTLGTGANQAAAGNHTHTAQSVFIPHNPALSVINGGYTVAAANNYGDYPGGSLSSGAKRGAAFSGYLHAAPTAVYVVVIPRGGTGNLAWFTTADFAASGEAYTTHSDSQGSDGTPQTTAVTSDQITQIDVTGSFTDAAAGDYFGLVFVRDGDDAADTVGSNVDILGLRIAY